MFWEGLKNFGRIWGRSWKYFLKPFYVRTPALSREAPRSVSMRGGPWTSLRVGYLVTIPSLILLLEGLRPFLRRARVSRRVAPTFVIPLLVGSFFRTFSLFFRIFFAQHRTPAAQSVNEVSNEFVETSSHLKTMIDHHSH